MAPCKKGWVIRLCFVTAIQELARPILGDRDDPKRKTNSGANRLRC